MRILERRRQADLASVRVQNERARWRAESGRLRALGARHRTLLTVSGGFVSGALVARIPWRGFARIGSFVGAIVSLTLRSPLGVMLFEGAAGARAADTQGADAAADD